MLSRRLCKFWTALLAAGCVAAGGSGCLHRSSSSSPSSSSSGCGLFGCSSTSGYEWPAEEGDQCESADDCDGMECCLDEDWGACYEVCPCFYDSECLGGQVCHGQTFKEEAVSSSDATPGQCMDLWSLPHGEWCDEDWFCEEGLICRAGQCGLLGGVGDDCDDDGECQGGLACAKLGSSYLCMGPVGSLWADCYPDEACDPGLYCETDGHYCTESQEEGEHCYVGDGSCADGLVCKKKYTSFVCAVPVEAGGSCFQHGECELGLVCSQTKPSSWKKCIPPKAVGEWCKESDECQEPLSCFLHLPGEQTLCGHENGPGWECQDDLECVEGLLCYAAPDDATYCHPPGGVGSPCAGDDECDDDLTCTIVEGNGVCLP